MRVAEMCQEVEVDRVLEVKPYACPPWVARPEVVICEDEEQAQAAVGDYQPGQVDLYVDASVRNGRAGIGVFAMPSRVRLSKTVASSEQADAHLTELLAIRKAANWPWVPACIAFDSDGRKVPASSIRIFSDAQSALLSVQSWRASACQKVVAEIVKKLHMSNVTLHWIPGHAGIEGNEEADKLAKAATRKESERPPRRKGIPWYLMRLALEKANIAAEFPQHRTAETGMFTRKIDAAFHLGKSAELYRQLSSAEAAILTQLRTGKTFLNEYLHKIKASDTALCDCGSVESIAHFLFACRRWRQQRTQLRQQHGQRFGELSYALGGYSSKQEGGQSIDGPMERWKADIAAVKATIEFAKATGRLQPNARHAADREEAEAEERSQLRSPSPTE